MDNRRDEVAALREEKEAFGRRISFLTTLATRAVAEGWTLPQLEAEMYKHGN
jgi:hypothetical protein